MDAKYIGSYITNNGATFGRGYEFSSKRKAIKVMREICAGETFIGSVGRVCVVNNAFDTVYEGWVR